MGYADDLVVFCKGKRINDTIRRMNGKLQDIAEWIYENQLEISYSKCESILF